MKVEDILKAKSHRVATMRPESAIDTVIHRMRLDRIGAIVISRDGSTIEGILSERDIVYGLVEHGAGLLKMTAADVMTHEVITCRLQDTIKDVMSKMTHRRIRHVPVVEQGELAGIVSIGDVVKHRLEEAELETTVLREAYIAAH
ncbi:MAG TPA: CBS domain-containing protein [Candidatus Angelobacter sp.]|nr:CBS domain-containing protein [Candidatus Angelobacter sp.]